MSSTSDDVPERHAHPAACYQGAPGAYSELAARALLGPDARLVPTRTLGTLFSTLANGGARYGVLPVENCLTGAVPDALDLLAAHPFAVTAETRVHIDHAILGPQRSRLRDIARVLSHPVALAQCREFFDQHPGIEPVPVFDTAGAVTLALQDATGRTAALASARAAALYDAAILAEHVQDHAENWTRFLLLDAAPEAAPQLADRPSRALVIFELPHAPGALARALAPLAAFGVNMTRIESRPVHGRPFEYRFITEVSAPTGAAIERALHAMRATTSAMRLLGHYASEAPPGS